MQILLIEDQEKKISSIIKFIKETVPQNHVNIVKTDSLEGARIQILKNTFDLIIFDVYLPIKSCDDSSAEDVSLDILSTYKHSQNYQTEAIAITQYEVSEIENLSLFNESGVTVVNYSDDDRWKGSLLVKLNRVLNCVKYDFLIFCALTKERSAFSHADVKLGEQKLIKGINCQEITLDGKNGLCIKPQRMGLVNMAITVTKAIEEFQPKIIAMSGICAGVPGEANFLDLIVAELCWEYQTGKFKNNEFKQEPYQSEVEPILLAELSQFSEDPQVLKNIKRELFASELKISTIKLAPISSGSAVIASEEKMLEIGLQHRKMTALEMEMYSMYEAANQSLCKPLCFGVKAVVDLGDAAKSDDLHEPACILSARFVSDFLKKKLSDM